MDLKQLHYFVTVAETGHITRAAAQLGMQQPPLSLRMLALERHFGMPLLHRHPKGVTLTDGGKRLLAESRLLLEAAAAMERRMLAVAAGEAGTLSVGFTSSAASHAFTPRVLRQCRQTYPGIALEIEEDHAAGLTEAVASGRLHAAFLRVPVSRPAGVAFDVLLREPVLLALPKGHRLAASGSVRLKELAAEPWILVRRDGAPGLYANLLSLCEREGFSARVTHQVERMLTALNLVASGEGVTVVPASMRGVHTDAVDYVELANTRALDAPLTLIHREKELQGALRSFVELARRLAPAAASRRPAAPGGGAHRKKKAAAR